MKEFQFGKDLNGHTQLIRVTVLLWNTEIMEYWKPIMNGIQLIILLILNYLLVKGGLLQTE